jgi:hypothetical protein
MRRYQKVTVRGLLALGPAGIVGGQDSKQSQDKHGSAVVGQNMQPGGCVGDFENDGKADMVVVTLDNFLRTFSYAGGRFWQNTIAIPKNISHLKQILLVFFVTSIPFKNA